MPLARSERLSANRYQDELDITDPAQIDEELVGWLRQAYER